MFSRRGTPRKKNPIKQGEAVIRERGILESYVISWGHSAPVNCVSTPNFGKVRPWVKNNNQREACFLLLRVYKFVKIIRFLLGSV